MPFTLAHPAAVLPLRGVRYLRTAALIIGAMVPDTYDYVPGNLSRYLHRAHSVSPAGYALCIALGYALLALLFVLRRPLTALLSARARWLCLTALAPFSSPLEWVFASLAFVLGASTHLLWDSFTHIEGLMVKHSAALTATVTLGFYRGPVYHVLQYVSSVLGLAVLAVWYWRLPAPPAAAAAPDARRSTAGPVLMLVVAAAVLIGGVEGKQAFDSHSDYVALHVFFARGLAWFALLYLVAGTIVSLEDTHAQVSDVGTTAACRTPSPSTRPSDRAD